MTKANESTFHNPQSNLDGGTQTIRAVIRVLDGFRRASQRFSAGMLPGPPAAPSARAILPSRAYFQLNRTALLRFRTRSN